jgi:serine protease Do
VKGETLGLNTDLDVGLVKITDEGEWPAVEMGDMKTVDVGDWCLATGHPGGYRKGRDPVVRLGRVILKRNNLVQTDCTLVGGDSGGPVFDMDGKVIGINSRIGNSTALNFHVPVSSYQDNWEKLVKTENWSNSPNPLAGGPVLGVSGDDDPKGCVITSIGENLPAEEAGLEVGDIITSLDGKPVSGFDSLKALVRGHKPGDRVRIEFQRGDETIKTMVKLAEWK